MVAMIPFIIQLLYGLSFFSMGIVVLLQSGLPAGLIPRSALLLLGLFGIAHGTHEFCGLLLLVLSRPQTFVELRNSVEFLDLVLLITSYVLLAMFAVDLLIKAQFYARRWRIIPPILLVLWSLSSVFYWQSFPSTSFAVLLADTKTFARYFVGFPGTLLSAYAFYSIARVQRHSLNHRGFIYLMGTASAFATYALFGGLIANHPARFFPASALSIETFEASFGFSVKLVRTFCAVTISGFVSLELVIEMGKLRTEWSRLREEFIAVIAHDLRSPLASIVTGAQLLERLEGDGSTGHKQKMEQIIKVILTGCNSLNRMISDLLDSSLVETHRVVLKTETIDVIAYLQNVLAKLPYLSSSNPIKVRLPDGKIYVDADPQRLEQILANLLSNARKYATPGTEISVEAELKFSEVIVSITNLGGGIRPEEQAMIFSRFQRSKSARKSNVAGIGLGLHIVKGLVEAHGGRVWVESVPEQNATFRFTLPLKQQSA